MFHNMMPAKLLLQLVKCLCKSASLLYFSHRLSEPELNYCVNVNVNVNNLLAISM